MRRRAFLRVSAAAAFGSALRRGDAAPAKSAAKVLIVGAGFAGGSCALALRRLNPAIAVTLIDPDDPYVTCPMSNSALVGLRSVASLQVPRRGLAGAGVLNVRDRVMAIDTVRRRVRLSAGRELSYDRLVVAPGIRFLWGRPQGYDAAAARLMPHAWQAGEQTELLAARLRAMQDGGVVAISVPAGPMRCPPGPFERASLIAGFLQRSKPRSKVLILDSNNHFPKQDVFTDAWQALYPGMIEWVSSLDDGAVVGVEPAKGILRTAHATHRVAVANVIPPQAPAELAVQAGLASDHGWCPIKAQTFESELVPGVHVIGDACIADPMPKSASAAHAQAVHCAAAIAADFGGREAAAAALTSVCYSLLSRGRALSIHGQFDLVEGAIRQVTPADSGAPRAEEEARSAEAWYRQIVADSFG